MTLPRFTRAHTSGESGGFTLTSLMVASALVLMVMASVISTQVFGLRMAQITEGKLGANAHARKMLSKMTDDAHSAQKWRLGSWSSNSFVEVGQNTPLVGNAVMLYPDSSNTNTYTRYYFDAADNTIKRFVTQTSPSATYTNTMATGVSNTVSFVIQDFNGNTLTNKSSRSLLVLNVPFTSLQNPNLGIGTGYYYQTYTLRGKIALQIEE